MRALSGGFNALSSVLQDKEAVSGWNMCGVCKILCVTRCVLACVCACVYADALG